jgi:hypothetical protein
MQMHLGMVAVMNAAIDFEDCFTTEGVDGVYCSETLFEVETVSQTDINMWICSCSDSNKGMCDATSSASNVLRHDSPHH